MSRPRALPLVAVLTAGLLGLLGPPSGGGGIAPPARAEVVVDYDLPVPGQVLRPFVPQEHEYGPGHRGVDLAVRPREAVRAAAGGEVSFAGRVAGARWVTLTHADGIRTSYGALADLAVTEGTEVVRGTVIGYASGQHGSDPLRPEPGLHWSARRGDRYLDPLTLVDAAPPRPTLVGEGGWRGTHPVVDPYTPYPGGSRAGLFAVPSPRADRPGYARPPNHHRLLQVPGYGTEGPSGVLDASYLGYDPEDVSYLSYRGCEPTADGCVPRPYGGQDTDLTIDEAVRLLDEQLRALQRAEPHRPVDLIGHSMGGDVIVTYLTYHYDQWDPDLPPVTNYVTVATPHGGAGTATVPRAIGDDPLFGRAAELLRGGLASLIPGLDRLSLFSEPVDRYGARIDAGRPARDPDRLAAKGITGLEIAGSRDMLVGRIDAGSAGDAYVLPGGHSSVLTTEAFHESVYRFLDGRDLAPIASRVGVGSDLASDAGRTLGTIIDLGSALNVARGVRAGDTAAVAYEGIKQLVGAGQRPDDPTRPEPLEEQDPDP